MPAAITSVCPGARFSVEVGVGGVIGLTGAVHASSNGSAVAGHGERPDDGNA